MDTTSFQTIQPEKNLMMSKLLTIAVPTFNRSEQLKLLLHTLGEELLGHEAHVELLISDNASTDCTPDIIQKFTEAYPSVKTIRHTTNVGMDANFCGCFEQATGRFFWMLGDDDLPKTGMLRQIVNLLEREDTDILYLNSEWMPHITSANDGEPVTALISKVLSRVDFARQVNVWVTFISGMVINLERLHELCPELNLHRFTGTSLVQLGWILPLLMTGNRFRIVQQRCILATSGNTGGYKLFAVFGTNFPAILDFVCGPSSRERQLIVKSLSWNYIPGLIWASRFGHAGKFISENVLESLVSLKSSPAYWLIMVPLATFPRPLAIPFLFISKFFSLQRRIRNYISSVTEMVLRKKSIPSI